MNSDSFREWLFSNKPIFIYLIAQLVKSFRHYKKLKITYLSLSQFFCNSYYAPTSSLPLMFSIWFHRGAIELLLLGSFRHAFSMVKGFARFFFQVFVNITPINYTRRATIKRVVNPPNIATQIQTLIRKQFF